MGHMKKENYFDLCTHKWYNVFILYKVFIFCIYLVNCLCYIVHVHVHVFIKTQIYM